MVHFRLHVVYPELEILHRLAALRLQPDETMSNSESFIKIFFILYGVRNIVLGNMAIYTYFTEVNLKITVCGLEF